MGGKGRFGIVRLAKPSPGRANCFAVKFMPYNEQDHERAVLNWRGVPNAPVCGHDRSPEGRS